jgi:hypothetical protein
MKKHHIYDPEDLESLMIHKSFNELLDAEREFALRHVEDAQAYDTMRTTLLAVLVEAKTFDKGFTPPSPHRRAALLDAYRAKHAQSKRPIFSLNGLSLLFDGLREKPWQQATGLAFIFLLALGVWYVASDDLTPAQRLAQIDQRETLQTRTMPANSDLEEVQSSEIALPETAANEVGERVEIVEDSEHLVFEDTDFAPQTRDMAEATEQPESKEKVTENTSSVFTLHSPATANASQLSEVTTTRSFSQGATPSSASEMDSETASTSIFQSTENLMSTQVMRDVLGEMTPAE